MDHITVIWTAVPILILTLTLIIIYRVSKAVERRLDGDSVELAKRRKWAINGVILVAAGPFTLLAVSLALSYPRVTEAFNNPLTCIPITMIASCAASIVGIVQRRKGLALIAGTLPAVAICLAIPVGTAIGLACLSNLYNRVFLENGFSEGSD